MTKSMKKESKPKVNYKDKIIKHKLQFFYRVVLCVLLVVSFTVLIVVQYENKEYAGYEILSSIPRTDVVDSVYKNYNGKILSYSKDGISAFLPDGKQLYNQTYEMQEPLVETSGEYVVAADYKGSQIFVMNSKGPVTTIDTNLPILGLCVSSKGVLCGILQENDTIWLRLFSSKGNVVANIKTSMKQSGYPVSVSISPDNVKLAVSFLKAEGGQVKTSVAFYNFGDVGQNELGNLVSGFDYSDEIIPFLEYPSEATAVAVGNKKAYFFQGQQRPKKEAEIDLKEEVQSVFCGTDSIAFVFVNQGSQEKYRIDLYNFSGKKKMSHKFDLEYSDLLFYKDQLIIYNQAEVMIVNARGVVKHTGDFGKDIQAIILADSKTKFYVVRSTKIDYLRLH